MDRVTAGCPLLASVVLSSCFSITDRTLHFLAARCPQLFTVEIELLDEDCCTDNGVAALIRGCPKLHPDNIISLCDGQECEIKGDLTLAAIGETRPDIKTLSISYAPLITGFGIDALVDGCKQIEVLSLCSCPSLLDVDYAQIVLGLPSLAYDNFDVSSDVWSVDTRGDAYLSAMAEVYGGTIGSAKELGLFSFYHRCTDAGFSTFIRKCTTAVESFDDVRQILDADLARGCLVGDMSVSAIVERFPSVSALNFNFCANLTDAGLEMIASAARYSNSSIDGDDDGQYGNDDGDASTNHTLTSIDLSNCASITAAGVASLVRACPNLLPCNIRQTNDKWHGISPVMSTDSVLHAIAETHGATLTAKQMVTSASAPQWFHQVGDAGLATLIQHCTVLFPTAESVRLFCIKAHMSSYTGYYVPPAEVVMARIGDRSVAAISTRFGSTVTELDLSNCGGVTDKGLACVAARCKALKRVNLLHCGGGSRGGAARRNRGQNRMSTVGSSTNGISPDGIAAIINGCANVASFGSDGLNCNPSLLKADVVVVAMARKHPSLTEAQLCNVQGWITGISEIGLAALIKNCPVLLPDSASIYKFCKVHRLLKRIDDAVVGAIVGRFDGGSSSVDGGSGEKTMICAINLSQCTSVSDRGLLLIAAGCAGLTSIDLTGTSFKLITDKGIAALLKKDACPDLHPDEIKCDGGGGGGSGCTFRGTGRKETLLYRIAAEERCLNLRQSASNKRGVRGGFAIAAANFLEHCNVQ